MENCEVKYGTTQDRFIDINKELDLSKLRINRAKYSIRASSSFDPNNAFILTESRIKAISQTAKSLWIDTSYVCVMLKKDNED